jgi:cytochrome o ubiquinol oxidase subunit 3
MTETALHHHEAGTMAHDATAKTIFGFWIYIMSDCILFASIFATFAVLRGNTFGGPSAKELFSLPFVLVETFILLTSSFTYGLAMLGMHAKKKEEVLAWLLLTFLLGASFLGMEVYEISHLITEGSGPGRSGFLSSFFTLVGTHGLHVFIGLLWMATLMFQTAARGFTDRMVRRLTCLSLFWHFLDLVWIFIFTIVYLMGAL